MESVSTRRRRIVMVAQRHPNEPLTALNQHMDYYAVTFNFRMLQKLRACVERVWLKWLNRRNRGRAMDWEWFSALLRTLPLAPARIVHSFL